MDTPSRSGYKNFLFYWFPILLYGAIIFYQSSRAVPERIPDVDYLDKLLHLLGYALLGALFVRAYRTTRIRAEYVVFLSILWSSLYGFSDELHQYFVPTRTASILDALADVAGSVLGAVGAFYGLGCRKVDS